MDNHNREIKQPPARINKILSKRSDRPHDISGDEPPPLIEIVDKKRFHPVSKHPIRINKILDKKLNHTKAHLSKTNKEAIKHEIAEGLVEHLQRLMITEPVYNAGNYNEGSFEYESYSDYDSYDDYSDEMSTESSENNTQEESVSNEQQRHDSNESTEEETSDTYHSSFSANSNDSFEDTEEDSEEDSLYSQDDNLYDIIRKENYVPSNSYSGQSDSYESDEEIKNTLSTAMKVKFSSDELSDSFDWEAEMEEYQNQMAKAYERNTPMSSKNVGEHKQDKNDQAHERDIKHLLQKKLVTHAFERMKTSKRDHAPNNYDLKGIEKRFVAHYSKPVEEVEPQPDRYSKKKY